MTDKTMLYLWMLRNLLSSVSRQYRPNEQLAGEKFRPDICWDRHGRVMQTWNDDQNYQIVGRKEWSGEIQTRILRWTLDLNRYRHLDDLSTFKKWIFEEFPKTWKWRLVIQICTVCDTFKFMFSKISSYNLIVLKVWKQNYHFHLKIQTYTYNPNGFANLQLSKTL